MKAVLFDLYETLVTEHGITRVRPAEQLGLTPDAYRRRWDRIKDDRLTGRIPTYADALRVIAPGVSDDAIARAVQDRIASKFQAFGHLDRDVLHMLHALRAADIRTCVVSNCAQEDIAPWPNSQLAQLVDSAIFSCAVGHTKPSRAIYELALAAVDVEPSQAVFVGDGGFDELPGAQAAGITAWWATWFLERWPKQDVAPAMAIEGFVRVRRPREVPVTRIVRFIATALSARITDACPSPTGS